MRRTRDGWVVRISKRRVKQNGTVKNTSFAVHRNESTALYTVRFPPLSRRRLRIVLLCDVGFTRTRLKVNEKTKSVRTPVGIIKYSILFLDQKQET